MQLEGKYIFFLIFKKHIFYCFNINYLGIKYQKQILFKANKSYLFQQLLI